VFYCYTFACRKQGKTTEFDFAKMRKINKSTKYNRATYKINLSQSDDKLLQRYCAIHKLGGKVAIKKILKTYLQESLPKLDEEAENQLELFKPFQRNIFDK
jgi:hypothetical protein